MLDRYGATMPKRSSITDPNQLAARIVAKTTGSGLVAIKKKNPAAVALGRLGGLVGGKARAESLSAQERKNIAKKGAQARWAKKNELD
jgi:hypothetical protein